MKILLVLPASEMNRVTEERLNPQPRKILRFSILALTTVAALTPEEHEVVICDENVEPIPWDSDADLVALSVMTAQAPRAYEIATRFKRAGKTVVAGGFHPSFMPDEALRHVDSVVIGEAEELWPQLLKDHENGTLQRRYQHDALPSLANLPWPRRDLMLENKRHYGTVYAMQAGRGCHRRCEFCSVTAFFRNCYRMRPVGDIIAELASVPAKQFIFVDDNIIADRRHARELFRRLVPVKKKWVSQCSIKIAEDEELLGLARAAGCVGLFIGIESTSAENLARFNKKFNEVDRYTKLIARLHAAGIAVIAGMMVGLDYDDLTVFERTLAFLDDAKLDALQLGILTPQPGTPLFARYEREGRVIDKDWAKYDFRHAVIRPYRMTTSQLQNGADWLYNSFYSRWRIAKRVARMAATLDPVATALFTNINLTYRRDNIRENVVGYNPAEQCEWGINDLERGIGNRELVAEN